jgi:hypothetical protein
MHDGEARLANVSKRIKTKSESKPLPLKPYWLSLSHMNQMNLKGQRTVLPAAKGSEKQAIAGHRAAR